MSGCAWFRLLLGAWARVLCLLLPWASVVPPVSRDALQIIVRRIGFFSVALLVPLALLSGRWDGPGWSCIALAVPFVVLCRGNFFFLWGAMCLAPRFVFCFLRIIVAIIFGLECLKLVAKLFYFLLECFCFSLGFFFGSTPLVVYSWLWVLHWLA